jgi:hypothetical protein
VFLAWLAAGPFYPPTMCLGSPIGWRHSQSSPFQTCLECNGAWTLEFVTALDANHPTV